MYNLPLFGLSQRAKASQDYYTQEPSEGPNIGNIMANNTTTNETTNATLDNGTGLLDDVTGMFDDPAMLLLGIAFAALAAYAAYTVPAVRVLVLTYLQKHDDKVMELLNKGLTAAQLKAFDKLDDAAKKYVKDEMVRNVILSTWDEQDDRLASSVKDEARKALDNAKNL